MFDPPHIGHLILAHEAAWQLRLDEVRLVVCARPAHREPPWLPADTRLRLVRAAVEGDPVVRASPAEIDRPGLSYTVDTLELFTGQEPDTAFHLIVGADQLRMFDRWRSPERIVQLARLAAVERDGDRTAEPLIPAVAVGHVDWFQMPAIGVSSTLIRLRIEADEPVGHLLPPGVADALAAEGLSVRLSALP